MAACLTSHTPWFTFFGLMNFVPGCEDGDQEPCSGELKTQQYHKLALLDISDYCLLNYTNTNIYKERRGGLTANDLPLEVILQISLEYPRTIARSSFQFMKLQNDAYVSLYRSPLPPTRQLIFSPACNISKTKKSWHFTNFEDAFDN